MSGRSAATGTMVSTMIETTAKEGALWDDPSQSMEDRLVGAIGMIDFQAAIIANKNKAMSAKDEMITILSNRINNMQAQLYQMSGDMNILAMNLHNANEFKKGFDNGIVIHNIVHVAGLGRIAISYLDSGMDERQQKEGGYSSLARAADPAESGSPVAQGEGSPRSVEGNGSQDNQNPD